MKKFLKAISVLICIMLAAQVLIACTGSLSYTGTTLAAAKVGVSYSQSIASAEVDKEVDIIYKLKEDSLLPLGLILSQAGDITGIPRNKTATAVTFTVIASAEGYNSTEAVFTIPSIEEGTLQFDIETLPKAGHNMQYAAQITVIGAATGVTYTKTGEMPTGLTFNAANGNITGTPTVMGEEKTFSITASATDCAPVTKDFTIEVAEPWLTYGGTDTTTIDDAYIGEFYSFNLATATGTAGSVTYALKSGSTFPAGLDWDAYEPGVLTGVPTTEVTRHDFTIVASATGYISAEATFRLRVRTRSAVTSDGTITYTSKAIPTAYAGQPFSVAGAVGGATASNRAPVSYTLATGATLPDDLQILPNGTLRSIVGLSVAGDFTFNVVAKAERCPDVSVAFTLKVDAPQLIFATNVTIPQATVGTAYSYSIANATAPDGATPVITYDLRASGAGSTMPAGMTLSPGGLVSGTPISSTKSHRFAVIASAPGYASKEADIFIVIRDAVVSGITRFEGEDINFSGINGGGESGAATEHQMVQRQSPGASNDYFIGFTHGVTGGALTFRINSSAAVSGLSFSICLGSELSNAVTLNQNNFNIRVNGVSINYSLALPVTRIGDTWSFISFTISSNVSFKAGENVIELEVIEGNDLFGPGRTGGPAIDYIEFGNLGGRSVLSWQPFKCNYGG